MTDLERALAHAQTMAGAEHRPDCEGDATCIYAHLSPPCSWEACESGCVTLGAPPTPDPACPGCVSDTERALWRQLADEYAEQVERGREETLT